MAPTTLPGKSIRQKLPLAYDTEVSDARNPPPVSEEIVILLPPTGTAIVLYNLFAETGYIFFIERHRSQEAKPMKIGQKVLLKIRRFPEQTYTIVYIGPHSVKVKDETGSIYTMKKTKVRFQLYGPPRDRNRTNTSVDAISIPIGGQPNSKTR